MLLFNCKKFSWVKAQKRKSKNQEEKMLDNSLIYEKNLNKNSKSEIEHYLKAENIKYSLKELMNLNKEKYYIKYTMKIIETPDYEEIRNLRKTKGVISIRLYGKTIKAEICNTKEWKEILMSNLAKFDIKNLRTEAIWNLYKQELWIIMNKLFYQFVLTINKILLCYVL